MHLINGVREMIKGVIAEDNIPFRNKLVQIITSLGIEMEYCTENAEELLKVIDEINPGIVFLDIGLPGLSGIEAAKRIRADHPDAEIIFITGCGDYLKEAMELYAADYITKPLHVERFKETLNRIKRKMLATQKLLQIKSGDKIELLRENDIYLVEAFKKKTIIHTSGKAFEADHSLKELEGALSDNIFFRTSRSYLVNIQKINYIKPFSRTSYEISFRNKNCKAYLSGYLYGEFRRKGKGLNER